MLKFGINGGDIEELAAIARQKSGAPVALVSQFSCNKAHDGNAEGVKSGPTFYDFHAVARKHRLLNIDLESWTWLRYGNPCANGTREALFKGDAQHLSEAGHEELGELVGKRLAEAHPFFFHKHRHQERPAHRHNEDIFCAASGEMLGLPEHDLATTFAGDGWTYDTDVPGRSDKACWMTTQAKATLLSAQAFEMFSSVEMFVQFSNKLQSVIHVGCDKGEIGRVNTTWELPHTLIERHIFRNSNHSFECDGKLHITATNFNRTENAPTLTKVCGVVVKK